MRADMGKVLVERPRLGGWRGDSGPERATQAAEEVPRRGRFAAGARGHEATLRPRHEVTSTNTSARSAGSSTPTSAARGTRSTPKSASTSIAATSSRSTSSRTSSITSSSTRVLIDGEPCRGERVRGSYGEPLRTSHRCHRWYVCPKSGLLRKSRSTCRASSEEAGAAAHREAEQQAGVRRPRRAVGTDHGRARSRSPIRKTSPAYDAILSAAHRQQTREREAKTRG